MTIKALELGAFDFITKPQSGSMADNMESIRAALLPIAGALAKRKEIRSVLASTRPALQGAQPLPPRPAPLLHRPASAIVRSGKSEIVAIGISTGGPNALAVLMPALPADLSAPLLIVQHMPPVFTTSLARSLDAKCAIHVKEAQDGEPITAGKALIAPGGRHMKVEASHDGKTRVVRITDDPPVNSCRPSVDYLFKSVAQHYVGRATGVIMTGMGSDGFEGLKLMKKNGAFVIAQDEQSCVVYGMPKGPVESGMADVVAPLDDLAQHIVKTLK
jgi:two-component system chemotaxis response regulator CheB